MSQTDLIKQCVSLYGKGKYKDTSDLFLQSFYKHNSLHDGTKLNSEHSNYSWKDQDAAFIDAMSIALYWAKEYLISLELSTYLLEHKDYTNKDDFYRYQNNRNYAGKIVYQDLTPRLYESYPATIIDSILQKQKIKHNHPEDKSSSDYSSNNHSEDKSSNNNSQQNTELKQDTELKQHSESITFTVTTCKRYQLFERTMNSFLHCCLDLDKIDRWICIDDNSSESDRQMMKSKYPFFEFIWKDQSQKGHAKSMNMLQEIMKTKYQFHCEDDWSFFSPGMYLTNALEIINTDVSIGQVLLNRNYAEVLDHVDSAGGHHDVTLSGLNYIRHQYITDGGERDKLTQFEGRSNHYYWPGFSFRPGLTRVEMFSKVGLYHDVIHFELEYGGRYYKCHYKTVFFTTIYCIHIGRLTRDWQDKTKPNAYSLNGVTQF